MRVKREKGFVTMSESVHCPNYGDMKHFNGEFDRVGDNEYKCRTCEAVMIVKEPVLIQNEQGRLRMEIVVALKGE